jgi:hypothetical protein
MACTGKPGQDITVRTKKMGQDSQEGTAKTGESVQDSQNRKEGNGCSEQRRQVRLHRTDGARDARTEKSS